MLKLKLQIVLVLDTYRKFPFYNEIQFMLPFGLHLHKKKQSMHTAVWQILRQISNN